MKVRPSINPTAPDYYMHMADPDFEGFPITSIKPHYNSSEEFWYFSFVCLDKTGDKTCCSVDPNDPYGDLHLHDMKMYPPYIRNKDLYWIFLPETQCEESLCKHLNLTYNPSLITESRS